MRRVREPITEQHRQADPIDNSRTHFNPVAKRNQRGRESGQDRVTRQAIDNRRVDRVATTLNRLDEPSRPLRRALPAREVEP